MTDGGTRPFTQVGRLTQVGRRVFAAGLASAVLSVGAAGCASAGPTAAKTASTTAVTAANPLASLSADQIAAKAVADLRMAASVDVVGSFTDSGQRIRLNMRLVAGKGCNSRMSFPGKGSFHLLMIGKVVWIKPNDLFWKSYGGANATVLQLLSGKYLKTSAGSGFGALSKLCRARLLARSFPKVRGIAKGENTVISGQPALQLTTTGSKGTDSMYVSVSARPQILRITATGSDGGQLDFIGYGTAVTLTAPPASQTLDGKKYGF